MRAGVINPMWYTTRDTDGALDRYQSYIIKTRTYTFILFSNFTTFIKFYCTAR